MNEIKIFTPNKKWDLPKLIAQELGVELGVFTSGPFADKETTIRFEESIRRECVFLIAENTPANKLMVLYQMLDGCVRASAAEKNVVLPYFGWARQDRMKGRDCVSAKLVADNIIDNGASSLLSMHLHFPQLTSFIRKPWDHLFSANYIIEWGEELKKKVKRLLTVVSPDWGAAALADYVARKLNLPLAILRKKRPKKNEATHSGIMGDVTNSDILMVDDIFDTFGTGLDGIDYLTELGAQDIYSWGTHGIMSFPAKSRIENCRKIKEIRITNTTPETPRKKSHKIKRITVHEVFAHAIKEIHCGGSIKSLFDKELFV